MNIHNMLKKDRKYNFNIELKDTYKEKYENDKSNLDDLHKYISCLLFGSQFVDSNGAANTKLITELNQQLSAIVHTGAASSSEVLYYFELNRALGNRVEIEHCLDEHPEYLDFCKLSKQSFEFLIHIGLFREAEKCLQDLLNTSVVDKDDYIECRSNLLIAKRDNEGALAFLLDSLADRNFYLPANLISKICGLACCLNMSDEILEIFRNGVREHPYVKWVSREYVKLCLERELNEEAMQEHERLKSVVLYLYRDKKLNKQNTGVFNFYCSVRKLVGLSYNPKDVAEEFGFKFDTEILGELESKAGIVYNTPWKNDFHHNGNKAFLKRSTKLSKQFRTFVKLFEGGEKEMIYAKSILGSFTSGIKGHFKELFGEPYFRVSDYDIFYESYPFYSLNGFTEEEIDEISALLNKIYSICIQLNPYVKNRSYIVNPMLADLFSVNTTLELENKTLEYSVVTQEPPQLTVFGVILFLSTFMDTSERQLFAYELAGSDLKLREALLKQVLKTIPGSKVHVHASSNFAEAGHEKCIFSLLMRKEIYHILLELECKILSDNNILEKDKPNANAKYYTQMLLMRYNENSKVFQNLELLYSFVTNGVLLGDEYDGEFFTIAKVIELLAECHEEDNSHTLFQAGIEDIFILCTNRKFYNQMKWSKERGNRNFLNNIDKYCRKYLFRNEVLMTEKDEDMLFQNSKQHLFTYIDDSQSKEFASYFGCKVTEWEKITVEFYKIDQEKYSCKINGTEVMDEYCMLCSNDSIEVTGKNGVTFNGWTETIVFDSLMSRCIIYET